MSLPLCATVGCPNRVRAGLHRSHAGAAGQELADGRTCWRCRAKRANPADAAPSYTQRRLLDNLAAGLDPMAGVHGQSEHGGYNGTRASCQRNGWVREGGPHGLELTPAGTAARARK